MKVHLISLGCPKNLVDSEKILGALGASGIDIAVVPEDSDIIIVNTCGFIEPARRETEQEIASMVERTRGTDTRLFVLGCAVNRFEDELKTSFPDVSGWFRLEQTTDLLRTISNESATKQARLLSTRGYAYLKIAEGCSNNCAYCTIPSIKGQYCSRSIDELEQEARELATLGARELILIAQDTARYGIDTTGRSQIHELVQRLSRINDISWIRLLYAHPKSITDELLRELRTNDKVCKYLDLPIQHINDRLLRLMNRQVSRKQIEQIIGQIKSSEAISLRTTVIAGLPTETDEEFNELLNFLEGGVFDWLGVFPYCRESGTPAARMPQVAESVLTQRYECLVRLQERLMKQRNQARIGETYRTLIHHQNDQYRGHAGFSAPEIDGAIVAQKDRMQLGQFYNLKIIDAKGCDLIGEVV